ncbi:hypothetical protein PJP10_12170 [Mycobacterium kansasii]
MGGADAGQTGNIRAGHVVVAIPPPTPARRRSCRPSSATSS